MRIRVFAAGIAAFCCMGMCAFAGGVPAAEAEDGNAGAVMKRVKTRLDGLTTLACSFRRTHEFKEMGRTQRIEGTLKLRKPGRLRVEYPAQTIVSDGKTSWTYSPKNNQVTVTAAGKGEEAYPTPQTIFRRYSSRKAELAGKERLASGDADIVRLVPESADDADVTVWIDRKLNFPVKTIEKMANGDVAVSELTLSLIHI
jgi:outer membrane lipoprotein carrier protein